MPMIRGRTRARAAFDLSLLFPMPPIVVTIAAFNLMTTRGGPPEKRPRWMRLHLRSVLGRGRACVKNAAGTERKLMSAPVDGITRCYVQPERERKSFAQKPCNRRGPAQADFELA